MTTVSVGKYCFSFSVFPFVCLWHLVSLISFRAYFDGIIWYIVSHYGYS